MKGAIARYMAEMRAALAARGRRADRLYQEIEGHLAERRDALIVRGLTAETAESEAVRCFGAAERLKAEISAQAPLETEAEMWLRILASLIAIGAGGFAALFAVLMVVFAEDKSAFAYGVMVLDALVALHALLFLRFLWGGRIAPAAERMSLFFGGIGFVALGAAATVWTAHLGLTSGDWEYYGFLHGFAVIALGSVAVWFVRPGLPMAPARPLD